MSGSVRCAVLVLSSLLFFGATEAASDTRAASTVLAMTLGGDCDASDRALDLARQEAARIWQQAGVELRWMTAEELPYESSRDAWLVARCVEPGMPLLRVKDTRVLPIAAIRFVGEQPTNLLVVSLDHANTLLERLGVEARDLGARFSTLRDIWLGRLVGRAIAHEVGHFLARSVAHTPRGLMKANHTTDTLVAESLYPFKIDASAVARGNDVLASRRVGARTDGMR